MTVIAIRQGSESSPDEFPEPDHSLQMRDSRVLVGCPSGVRRFVGEQGGSPREHFPVHREQTVSFAPSFPLPVLRVRPAVLFKSPIQGLAINLQNVRDGFLVSLSQFHAR